MEQTKQVQQSEHPTPEAPGGADTDVRHICQDTDREPFGGRTTRMLDSRLYSHDLNVAYLPTDEVVPTGELDQSHLAPGSDQASPPENKETSVFKWIKTHVRSPHRPNPNRANVNIHRDRPRAGSASSHTSSRSQSSQVSWDKNDQFEQLLELMARDLDSYNALIGKTMPSVAARVLGGEDRSRRRAECMELRTELQQFSMTVAGCLSMSGETNYNPVLYWVVRGECYTQLQELHRTIKSDLDGLNRAIRAKDPEVDKIVQVRQRLKDHHLALGSIAGRMQDAKIEDSRTGDSVMRIIQ